MSLLSIIVDTSKLFNMGTKEKKLGIFYNNRGVCTIEIQIIVYHTMKVVCNSEVSIQYQIITM